MIPTLRLTAEQLTALGLLADNGPARLATLATPGQEGPVAIHFDDASVVVHEDGAFHRSEPPSVERGRAA